MVALAGAVATTPPPGVAMPTEPSAAKAVLTESHKLALMADTTLFFAKLTIKVQASRDYL